MGAKILGRKKVSEKKEKKQKPVSRAKKVRQKVRALRLVGIDKLVRPYGARKRKKLLGRGPGSGHGKTSTRGSKGQTSRAGRDFYLGFEGGTSPLIRRIPKRGFTSRSKKEYQIVNLSDLNRIKQIDINPELLKFKGLIKNKDKLVKILGKGEIKNPIRIAAHAFSKRAFELIKTAGGQAQIINV